MAKKVTPKWAGYERISPSTCTTQRSERRKKWSASKGRLASSETPSWLSASLPEMTARCHNDISQAYGPFPGDTLGHLPSDRVGDCNTGSKGGTHSACAASYSNCSRRPPWSHNAFPWPPPEPYESPCQAHSSLKPSRWKLTACKLESCSNATAGKPKAASLSFQLKWETSHLNPKSSIVYTYKLLKGYISISASSLMHRIGIEFPSQANLEGKTLVSSIGELSNRKHILRFQQLH